MSYDVEKLRERLRIVERERDVLRDTLAKFQQESAKLPAMLEETINNYKSLNRSLEEELVSVRSECDELKALVSDLMAKFQQESANLPAMLQETVNNYKTLNQSLEEELVSVRSKCDELKAKVSDLKTKIPEGSVTPPENSNDSLRHIIQKLTR